MNFSGMFTYDKKAGVYWFSTTPREDYQEFNLVGVVSLTHYQTCLHTPIGDVRNRLAA